MSRSTCSSSRLRNCLLIFYVLSIPALWADLLPSPALPPVNSVYVLDDTCISAVCLKDITLSDFNVTSSLISGGNELTSSTVDLKANAYQNVGGMPGVFIGPVVLSGDIDITFFSRDTLSEPGDFSAQITSLDLSGSFSGLTGQHTAEAMLNPSNPSTGETSVEPADGHGFQITSFFDVFAELSIDNGPFIPGPERTAHLSETPEPAYFGLVGAALILLAAHRIVKARRRIVASGRD